MKERYSLVISAIGTKLAVYKGNNMLHLQYRRKNEAMRSLLVLANQVSGLSSPVISLRRLQTAEKKKIQILIKKRKLYLTAARNSLKTFSFYTELDYTLLCKLSNF